MSSLEQEHTKLVKEWTTVCQSKNYEQIISFFESHKEEIVSSGSPWFLSMLIKNEDIDSMKYILQQSNPEQYINSEDPNTQNPLQTACYEATFEMIRVLESNGAKIPKDIGSGLIDAVLLNKKIKEDEIYLCVEHLLNLNGKIHSSNILFRLACDVNLSFNRIKMANLIKSKRPEFVELLSQRCYLGWAIGYEHFAFAEYLMDHGAKLDAGFFTKSLGLRWVDPNDIICKWLIKHDVDINGNTNEFNQNQTITPLFQSCIDKKYKIMELLLNNGADINKKCMYQNQQTTPLEYCKKTFQNKYYEYFKNYKAKHNERNNLFVGVDLSNVPNTAYESNLSFNDEALLDEMNNKYLNTKKEINDLENELNTKYNYLRELFIGKTEIMNKKENIEKWKNAQNSWIKFLNQWKNWDVMCFIEYLKRIKYVEKSYNEYYSSDNICKQNIENYIKNNLNQFEQKNNYDDQVTYFKGSHLLKFNDLSIQTIGITSKNDTESVHTSIKQLIITNNHNNNNLNKEEKKDNDKNDNLSQEDKLRGWLTNIVKLPQYIDVFIANDITLEIIPEIGRDALKEMCVKSIGHQMTILKHAKQLKQNEGMNVLHETDYI